MLDNSTSKKNSLSLESIELEIGDLTSSTNDPILKTLQIEQR